MSLPTRGRHHGNRFCCAPTSMMLRWAVQGKKKLHWSGQSLSCKASSPVFCRAVNRHALPSTSCLFFHVLQEIFEEAPAEKAGLVKKMRRKSA